MKIQIKISDKGPLVAGGSACLPGALELRVVEESTKQVDKGKDKGMYSTMYTCEVLRHEKPGQEGKKLYLFCTWPDASLTEQKKIDLYTQRAKSWLMVGADGDAERQKKIKAAKGVTKIDTAAPLGKKATIFWDPENYALRDTPQRESDNYSFFFEKDKAEKALQGDHNCTQRNTFGQKVEVTAKGKVDALPEEDSGLDMSGDDDEPVVNDEPTSSPMDEDDAADDLL